MRYSDTSFGDATQTVAKWLQDLNTQDIQEFRIQSGYFHWKAVHAIKELLHELKGDQKHVSFLIGANDCETLYSDICNLARCMGLPSGSRRLGVVAFSNALFHPKVYHAKMTDGRQEAFVGSANFTEPGIAGLNIEAGIALDSSDNDSVDVLGRIAGAIDQWFERNEDEGFYEIGNLSDAEELRERGILSVSRPPRQRRPESSGKGSEKLARRKVLISIPVPEDNEEDSEDEDGRDRSLEDAEPEAPDDGETQETGDEEEHQDDTPSDDEEGQTPYLPCVTLSGFPDYLLFAPDAEEETIGYEALSGLPLPKGAVGLVMRLKPATARRFTGKSGTADINIPIKSIKTIRFGRAGRHKRPCARVLLRVRYISTSETDQAQIVMPQLNTSIQGYGYTSEESGHQDIRMTVPSVVENLKTAIEEQGFSAPAPDDLFLLEWPNSESDCFGVTFLGRGSEEEATARRIYEGALAEETAFRDMCWLPPNRFPDWNNP